jgi:hypothetical protein
LEFLSRTSVGYLPQFLAEITPRFSTIPLLRSIPVCLAQANHKILSAIAEGILTAAVVGYAAASSLRRGLTISKYFDAWQFEFDNCFSFDRGERSSVLAVVSVAFAQHRSSLQAVVLEGELNKKRTSCECDCSRV